MAVPVAALVLIFASMMEKIEDTKMSEQLLLCFGSIDQKTGWSLKWGYGHV